MKLHIHQYNLPLKHTFKISHESRTVQPSLITELIDNNGLSGYGEATATAYYGITIERMLKVLKEIEPWLAQYNFQNPELFYTDLELRLPNDSFVRCALDVAANDLWARQHQKPLYEMWDLNPKDAPTTSYTIGQDSMDKMVTKMLEKPWPIYKIKLGMKDDLKIIRRLRAETDAIFRVDANTAWQTQETINKSFELKELGVEFIEQPQVIQAWEGHKTALEGSALPIIADENCQTEADIVTCAPYFNGVNIKLVKCGGLTPAKRMIDKARQLNLKVMMGCMTESSVGISAIAHIAPLLDYVDMDGALLLSKDPARGVFIDKNAQLHYSTIPGTGVQLINKH